MADQSSARMQAAMAALDAAFPDCAIALIVAPTGSAPGRRANWVSNAKRADMVVLLKEVVARFEGRVHDAPEAKQ